MASYDADALRAASESYRAAVVRLRGVIKQFDRELGPHEVEQAVGMMMEHTTSMSRWVLTAELRGHMESK